MTADDWIDSVFVCRVCEREKGSSKVFDEEADAVKHFEEEHLRDLQESRGVISVD